MRRAQSRDARQAASCRRHQTSKLSSGSLLSVTPPTFAHLLEFFAPLFSFFRVLAHRGHHRGHHRDDRDDRDVNARICESRCQLVAGSTHRDDTVLGRL